MDAGLRDPLSLRLEDLSVSGGGVALVAMTAPPFGLCPQCHNRSARVHRSYVRVLLCHLKSRLSRPRRRTSNDKLYRLAIISMARANWASCDSSDPNAAATAR
jgi:hypothetical protein